MNISKTFKTVLIVLGVVVVVIAAASVLLASLNTARMGSTSLSISDNNMMAPSMGGAYDRDESSTGSSYDSYNQKAVVAESGVSTQAVPSDVKQIIKTGSLELVVENVEASADAVVLVAEKFGGFATSRDISDSQSNKKRGTVTLRVPNASFEDAMKEVKGVATKVTRETANTQDVTEEYVDLLAQLKNKQAVEAQYLKTLERAYAIEDILSVQERLDRTRGEIEQLQGRITYLERQVGMSTIRVSLVSESEAAVFGVVWNPLTKIKQAAYQTLESLVSFVYFLINLVFAIPVILLWVATIGGLVYVVFRGIVWMKRRLQTPSV